MGKADFRYIVCFVAAMLIACFVTADLSVAKEPVVDSRLVLWLDAQDVAGSGGEGNVSVDGASLARWTDKSPAEFRQRPSSAR